MKQSQSQQQPSIRKLLDLSQDKFQNSKGLTHWGKIQNLKIMADTMKLLREKGLTDLVKFDSKIIQKLFQKEYIYEDTKGNAVFVGFDEQAHHDTPRYEVHTPISLSAWIAWAVISGTVFA